MASNAVTARTFPRRKGPVRAETRTWCLHVQGGHLQLRSHENEYEDRPGGKRKPIMGFSPAARLRMLQLIDEINWLAMGPGLFITMTLPDEVWPHVVNRMTQVRSQWVRDSENFLGVKFPTLWRVEWEMRRSGVSVGLVRPHWHMLCPGLRWYDRKDATAIWKRIIGHTGPVSFKVKRMDTKRKHAVYIAKYCAKKADNSSLDYVAYLNKFGRHWGVTRKGLLTMHPKRSYNDIPLTAVHEIRKLMECHREGYSSLYDAGFTSFGPWSQAVNAVIERIAVDSGTRAE